MPDTKDRTPPDAYLREWWQRNNAARGLYKAVRRERCPLRLICLFLFAPYDYGRRKL